MFKLIFISLAFAKEIHYITQSSQSDIKVAEGDIIVIVINPSSTKWKIIDDTLEIAFNDNGNLKTFHMSKTHINSEPKELMNLRAFVKTFNTTHIIIDDINSTLDNKYLALLRNHITEKRLERLAFGRIQVLQNELALSTTILIYPHVPVTQPPTAVHSSKKISYLSLIWIFVFIINITIIIAILISVYAKKKQTKQYQDILMDELDEE